MSCGSPTQNPRDPIYRVIREQVSVYGMTTRMVLRATSSLQSYADSELVRSLRDLTGKNCLRAYPLHHGRFYFTFTEKEADRCQTEQTRGGPFNERDKFRAFARLMIGTAYSPTSIPLSRSEAEILLGTEMGGAVNNFMIRPEVKTILGITIDTAIHAFPARPAQKLRDDVLRYVRYSNVKSLVAQSRFEIVLVAATQPRSDSILKHFRLYDRVGGTPVNAIVIPELLPRITPVPVNGGPLSHKP